MRKRPVSPAFVYASRIIADLRQILQSEPRSLAFVTMLNAAKAKGEANGFSFAKAVAASRDAIIAEARRSR